MPAPIALTQRLGEQDLKLMQARSELRACVEAVEELFGPTLADAIARRVDVMVEEQADLVHIYDMAIGEYKRALANAEQVTDRVRNAFSGEAATVRRLHVEEVGRLQFTIADQRRLLSEIVEEVQVRHARSHRPLPEWFVRASAASQIGEWVAASMGAGLTGEQMAVAG